MSGVRRNPSPEKLAFAREMRANPTDFEKKLWPRLKNMTYAKFTDQVVMGGYILDFYCDDLKLAVELDGKQHDIHYDTTRDSQLFARFGISIIRFPNPKDEAAINAIVWDVRAECRWRRRRIKLGFPIFPNRSSLATNKSNGAGAPVETCSKVEKFNPSIVNPGCARQVFATVESADITVIALRHIGIEATVELCPTCRLIHLTEKRVE